MFFGGSIQQLVEVVLLLVNQMDAEMEEKCAGGLLVHQAHL
jgi:hypothetical protein